MERLLDYIFHEPHEQCGDLRAGSHAAGIEPVIPDPLDQAQETAS